MTDTDPTDAATPEGGHIRTFIYGSCVSRDTFEYLGPEFELVRYVARQSAISAGTDAAAYRSRLGDIASAFQSRNVHGDLAGDLPEALAETAAEGIDVVLLDLVDERGGVVQLGRGYVTKLQEFWSHGGLEMSRGRNQFLLGSDEHFRLWRVGMSRMLGQLRELGLLSRTLLLRTPWAAQYDDGENLEVPEWMIQPDVANVDYERYFDFLERQGVATITLPDELARTPRDHQWGASPFHYVPAAYEWLSAAITEFATTPRSPQPAPALGRRDTAAWGDFVEIHDVAAVQDFDVLPELLTVWREGYPLDLQVEDVGATTTLVSLHAALGSTGLQPPIFTGRSVSSDLGLNRIFISDASLLAEEELGLAWYLGTKELDLTGLIVEVVAALQEKMGAQHLVFFGMSGGAFAALNLAHEFPGSLAVPVNPQTRILDYLPLHWANAAKACLGAADDEEAADVLEGHPRADLRRLYARDPGDAWVIYVQNSLDPHVTTHMVPWLDAVGWDDRVSVLMQDWGTGHRPPPGRELRTMISAVAGVDGDWTALARRWKAKQAPDRDWIQQVTGR